MVSHRALGYTAGLASLLSLGCNSYNFRLLQKEAQTQRTISEIMSIARPILDQINQYESPDTKKIVVTNIHGTAIVYCENPTFQEWRSGNRFPTKPYLVAHLDNRVDSREELGIGRSAVERISALTDRDDLNWEVYYTERLPENERIALSNKYNLLPATQAALDAMTYLEVDYLLPSEPQPARREDYKEFMRKQRIQERKEKIAIKKEN